MFIAIAVETTTSTQDYKVWYVELDKYSQVIALGVKDKNQLVASMFDQYRNTGRSDWRALTKDSEQTTPIELFDFISLEMYHNTHFGNLPTLAEFQKTIDHLQLNLEIKAIAS